MRETLVHEVQHIIQPIEGMDVGYSLEQARDVIRSRYGDTLSETELEARAFDLYNRRKGEVDARTAERRLYLTELGRWTTRPSESADISDGVWASRSEQATSMQQNRRTEVVSDGYSINSEDGADRRRASYYRGEPTEADLAGREGRSAPGEGRGTADWTVQSGREVSTLDRVSEESGGDGELRVRETTRRPSIITTSEEARREGERVVSDGTRTRSRLDQYLERNGGTGRGQRLLDAVVPLFFNANRMVGRVLGWDVFDKLEQGLATAPGRAAYAIERGNAEAGLKSFGEIVNDIPLADRDRFETTAAYYNLRDIANDRRALMDQRDNLHALAKDEKSNADIIRKDLRKNRALYSGEEIRLYEDAAEGSRKRAAQYEKEASEIQKALDHKRTQKTASWYDEQINKALEEHPEWEEKIQELVKWGQHQLQEFVDMGVVSEETAAKARAAHPNYIPLMRNGEESLSESLDATAHRYQQGVLDMINPLKRYTGDSEGTLSSPVEQLINMQYRIEGMKARQQVLTMVAERAEAGEYGDLLRRIEKPEDLQRGEVALNIYRNGEKITYAVDEGVRALIDAHEAQQMTKLDRILRIPGAVLRGGVTKSPTFAISNALRDTFTTSIINPEVRPVIDTVRGLMSALTNDSSFDDFLRHGGDQQMRWSTRDERRKNTRDLYKQPSLTEQPRSAWRPLNNFLDRMAELSELSTRVGTYMRLVECGVDPDTAAFRTINTMWFNRGGTFSKGNYARNIPFFNAALQGTYSLGRAFSKDGHFEWNSKAAMNGLLYFAIPSMLITAWNLGDDDRRKKYLEIPEQQRNTYYNFVLGDTVYKIPKAHAPGIVFSSLPERFMDYLYANDKRAFDGLVASLIDNLGPDLTPSFMRLPFELALNKSLFYQRDIVPASEQRYAPRDQYGPYTSDTARWMAEIIYKGSNPVLNLLGEDGWQVSPRKIEYAINQLTGNLGREILTAMDYGVRLKEGRERPDSPWHQSIPLTRRFAAETSAMRRTENNFRETLSTALADVNSAAEHAKDTPRSQLPERERKLLGAKNSIQQLQTKELRAITELRKEIREIAGDKRMDGARKRRLMDVREAKIRRISETGLQKLDRILSR